MTKNFEKRSIFLRYEFFGELPPRKFVNQVIVVDNVSISYLKMFYLEQNSAKNFMTRFGEKQESKNN